MDNFCARTSLIRHKQRLEKALDKQRSLSWCLTLWSRFIRARDGHRCVCCDSRDNLQAHHIWRRTTYQYGWFELGNGITLCRNCHKVPHAQFNGPTDLQLPLGAQGGDDQDEIAFLYGALWEDAKNRSIDQNEFYFISDKMLNFFVAVQGYEHYLELVHEGSMTRIRMAHAIWRNMPEAFYVELASSLFEESLAIRR